MKKQVIFIHGGMAFSNYDAFLEHLRTCELGDPLADRPKRWTDSLKENLGGDFEVFMPALPNKQNAKYEEWKIWFERYCQFLRDGAVIVGWSLGGYFLLKYLSENKMPVRITAVYLLAVPAEPDDHNKEDGGDFGFDLQNIDRIGEQAEKVVIMHSVDDSIVPYSHAQKLRALLRGSELVTFENRGHFMVEAFPELAGHLRGVFDKSAI